MKRIRRILFDGFEIEGEFSDLDIALKDDSPMRIQQIKRILLDKNKKKKRKK